MKLQAQCRFDLCEVWGLSPGSVICNWLWKVTGKSFEKRAPHFAETLLRGLPGGMFKPCSDHSCKIIDSELSDTGVK